jgi:hypothetical protein
MGIDFTNNENKISIVEYDLKFLTLLGEEKYNKYRHFSPC